MHFITTAKNSYIIENDISDSCAKNVEINAEYFYWKKKNKSLISINGYAMSVQNTIFLFILNIKKLILKGKLKAIKVIFNIHLDEPLCGGI